MFDEDEEPIVIPLGNNLIAWISPEDEELCMLSWQARSGGLKKTYYYAVNRVHVGKNQKTETFMHNLVWERMMGGPVPIGYLVDHINRDKLDNRRINLRLATRSQNEANKAKRVSKSSSRYKGVTFTKSTLKKPWRATITNNKKHTGLGYFATEEEAAQAYNDAALEMFSDFAYLNNITDKRENDE
jgi:hypothetical protein